MPRAHGPDRRATGTAPCESAFARCTSGFGGWYTGQFRLIVSTRCEHTTPRAEDRLDRAGPRNNVLGWVVRMAVWPAVVAEPKDADGDHRHASCKHVFFISGCGWPRVRTGPWELGQPVRQKGGVPPRRWSGVL